MDFFTLVLALFLVQDPIGNIPVCLGLLRNVPRHRHIWFVVRENLIALFISTVFLINGQNILCYLHITQPALGLAGGFILFVVAFKMLFPKESLSLETPQIPQEPFIVPLAMPLLAGPSTIATITFCATKYPNEKGLCFLALVVAGIFSTITLLCALPLKKWLSDQLLRALEQLMGFILITLSTQMILNNLCAHFKLVGLL